MKPVQQRVASALLLIACGAAAASDFPARPVHVVVPFAAGGGSDVVVRLAAPRLQQSLKQTIVVDNKPGAASVIGSDSVAKAPADGHTVLFNIPSLLQTSFVQAKLPYDPLRDLIPVTTLVSAPVWLAVSTSRVQAAALPALQAEGRKAGNFEYASWGNGATNHLFGHALASALGLTMVHVPYKGGAPAVLALANGEVAMMFSDYVSLRPHLASGKVRIIASTGPKRHRLTPEVPTLAELGHKGFESVGWGAIFVPAGTPADVVARLEREFAAVARDPEFVAKVADLGYEAGGKPQAEFAAEVRADFERWARLFREAGIKPE
jgi:tripartite-type tricarboxylate transporter receptor subunit TctC